MTLCGFCVREANRKYAVRRNCTLPSRYRLSHIDIWLSRTVGAMNTTHKSKAQFMIKIVWVTAPVPYLC
ncbi:hypothetical protein, partial [Candidatus Hakubella thermalkaliphila]|uniref:hypothetical protein n=1 Tax=Candidatus Hakubella thermalkaliphila TaxID=2754717 RepID=UPI001C615AA6